MAGDTQITWSYLCALKLDIEFISAFNKPISKKHLKTSELIKLNSSDALLP
jgi:hypothetical protein